MEQEDISSISLQSDFYSNWSKKKDWIELEEDTKEIEKDRGVYGDYYWNDKYQDISDRVCVSVDDTLKRAAELKSLVDEFVKVALPKVDSIIEGRLEPDLNTHGAAGGTKYRRAHIFFKFPIDIETRNKSTLYGSEENAMKVANHELKSMNAILSTHIKFIHVPFTVSITTKGYRVLCQSNLPIGSDTLTFGSENASDINNFEYHQNQEFNEIMRQIASKLKLKEHLIRDKQSEKCIYGPVDLEGHIGKDGRMYLLDAARLFPPTKDTLFQGGSGSLHNLIRPEFLSTYSQPLNPDAFGSWNPEDIDGRNHIIQATSQIFGSKVIEVIAVMKNLFQSNSEMDITSLLHSKGVNIRYLGAVIFRLHADKQFAIRDRVIGHGVARSFKLELNSRLRNSSDKKDDILKQIIVDSLNLLCGTDDQSIQFWKNILAPRFTTKFLPQLKTRPDMQPFQDISINLRSIVLPLLKTHVLSDIKKMMGMNLKDDDVFDINHLDSIPVKVKNLDLNPWLNIYNFKDLEQFYLHMKEKQQKQNIPQLAYTLTYLGDLYASEMSCKTSTEIDFKGLMIKAEKHYIESFNKLLDLAKVNPASPTDAQATSDVQRPHKQYQIHAADIAERLAELYMKVDKPNLAKELLGKSIMIKENTFQKPSDQLVECSVSLCKLGRACFQMGEFQNADDFFKKAETASRKRALGPYHLEYARVLTNTLPYLITTDLAQATSVCTRAMEIASMENKTDSLEYAVMRDNYGQILLREKKFGAAVNTFRSVWDSKKRNIGELHYVTAISLDHWAIAGTLDGSVEPNLLIGSFLFAIETFEKTTGKMNHFEWKTRNNLSGCYWKFGRFKEAQEEITKSNNLFISKYPNQNFPFSNNLTNIANGNTFSSITFEIAYHESYVGFTDKSFEIHFLPPDLYESFGVAPYKVVDILQGQDILQEVSKMLVPHITRSSTSTPHRKTLAEISGSSSARSIAKVPAEGSNMNLGAQKGSNGMYSSLGKIDFRIVKKNNTVSNPTYVAPQTPAYNHLIAGEQARLEEAYRSDTRSNGDQKIYKRVFSDNLPPIFLTAEIKQKITKILSKK